MASKSSLYSVPRPRSSTTNKEPSTSSSSLAFTSTLSSLLASSTSTSTSTVKGRPRPSKTSKDSIFTAHNKGSKKRALADISSDDGPRPQTHAQSSEAIDAATLHRSKRKMEEKARLYASMKRGDYVPPTDGASNKEEAALVDFDRKWAETVDAAGGEDAVNYSTSSDDGGESEPEEMIEYEDEFGRLRRGTRFEAARELRKRNVQAHAREELASFAARPERPANLIYGDTVQSGAFNLDEPAAALMADLARKRDRSMTPPEEVHYDASKEVRSKGVGFYAFSQDKEGREREMEGLKGEREETERMRREREERREEKRKKVEERRRVIGEKRGKKLAERFLDGLDMPDGDGDAGGGGGES